MPLSYTVTNAFLSATTPHFPPPSIIPERPSVSHRLPWDVLALTLSLADTPTLAALGRVSNDFLIESTPHLYRHVVINSVEDLGKLFCKRTESEVVLPTPSRINHLLSLSQIKTLTLNFTSPTSLPGPLLHLSFSRLPTSALQLDYLHLSSHYQHRDVLRPLHQILLPRLDPRHVAYEVNDRKPDENAWFDDGSGLPLIEWSRLEGMEFKGMLTRRWHRGESFLGCLPTPNVERRRTIRLHLASLLTSQRGDAPSFLEFVQSNYGAALYGLNYLQEGSVVLVVESDKERREADAALSMIEPKWRHVFVVEMLKI